MAAYGVTVEKEAQFRGSAELFSNVWHYAISAPVAADYEALADAVVAKERAFFNSEVTFKTVRVYGPTDLDPEDNLIRFVEDLSGTGTGARAGGNAYPELCYTVSVPAGRSETTQRRIYLRKYLRVIRFHGSTDSAQTGLLTSGTKTAVEAFMNDMLQIGSPVTFDLVTPRNQAPPAGASATCLQYAHIRQMKQ